MTKREIIQWLKEKESEALCAATATYEAELEAHRAEWEKKIELEGTVRQIKVYLESALNALEIWEAKFGPMGTGDVRTRWLYCEFGGGIRSALHPYTKSDSIHDIMGTFVHRNVHDTSGELQAIKGKYEDMQRGIKREYENLRTNVNSRKTADFAKIFLEDLGFVLPASLTKISSTSLAKPVDMRYLIVKTDVSKPVQAVED